MNLIRIIFKTFISGIRVVKLFLCDNITKLHKIKEYKNNKIIEITDFTNLKPGAEIIDNFFGDKFKNDIHETFLRGDYGGRDLKTILYLNKDDATVDKNMNKKGD